jgi:hypothetical protein
MGNIDSAGGSTSTTFSSTTGASSLGSSRTLANPVSNATGVLLFDHPMATSLSAGEYWYGVLGTSSTTTAGTSTNLASWSNIVLTHYLSALKRIAFTTTSNSHRLVEGNGIYNTAATTANITLSSVGQNAGVISMYMNFDALGLSAT